MIPLNKLLGKGWIKVPINVVTFKIYTWFVAITFSSSSILFLRAESVVPVFDSVTVPCGDLKVG